MLETTTQITRLQFMRNATLVNKETGEVKTKKYFGDS